MNLSLFILFNNLLKLVNNLKINLRITNNENLAEIDLIISSVYFYQDKYEDFLKIIDKVNRYLQKTDGLEMLKCKILYFYSEYFLKIGNYQKAEAKINKAIDRYNNITVNKSIKDSDMQSLKAKLLYYKANLVLAKNSVNKTTDTIILSKVQ